MRKMNKELFVSLTKDLLAEREALKQAKALTADLQLAMEATDQYVEYSKQKTITSDIGKSVSAKEINFKKLMLEDTAFEVPFKSAYFQKETTCEIDENAALKWARVNMPAAITEVVDLKMLSDFALKNKEKATYAKITEGKKVLLASDLSQFAKELEGD